MGRTQPPSVRVTDGVPRPRTPPDDAAPGVASPALPDVLVVVLVVTTAGGGPAADVGRPDGSRAGGVDDARAPGSHVNPLTPKEQEVLAHLADLLTTEEIARSMFVSVNTVRSHVRSILLKLGVSRRNEAVRRAWELHLLPPRNAA